MKYFESERDSTTSVQNTMSQSSYGYIVTQSVFYNLGMATSLREGKAVKV